MSFMHLSTERYVCARIFSNTFSFMLTPSLACVFPCLDRVLLGFVHVQIESCLCKQSQGFGVSNWLSGSPAKERLAQVTVACELCSFWNCASWLSICLSHLAWKKRYILIISNLSCTRKKMEDLCSFCWVWDWLSLCQYSTNLRTDSNPEGCGTQENDQHGL